MWPWYLTLWHGNGGWHIANSWSHMKWISELGTGLLSGHCKNFKQPMWSCLLTFHPENGATFQPNRDGATERKRQKLLITDVTFISNDRSDLDLWLFVLEMDRDTWTVFVPSIKQIGQIGTERRSGHYKKWTHPVALAQDLSTWNRTWHKDL